MTIQVICYKTLVNRNNLLNLEHNMLQTLMEISKYWNIVNNGNKQKIYLAPFL